MDKELALLNMQNNYYEMEHLIPSDGSLSPKINLDENDAFCQARTKLRRMMYNGKKNIESDKTAVQKDSRLKIKTDKRSKITKNKHQHAENEIHQTLQNIIKNQFGRGVEHRRPKEDDAQHRILSEKVFEILDNQNSLSHMRKLENQMAGLAILPIMVQK